MAVSNTGNRSSSPAISTSSGPSSSSSGEKRRHSDLGNGDEADDGHHNNGRRKRTKPRKPWVSWGRTAARIVDAFTTISLMVHWYLKVTLAEVPLDKLSDIQQRYYDSCVALMVTVPGFKAEVASKTLEEMDDMIDKIQDGQNNARGTDTNRMKTTILAMVRQLYPEKAQELASLSDNDKVTRGFNHPVLGMLLCPVNMDWDDPKVKADLHAFPGSASEAAWARFFYPKDQFDSNDLTKGFLRGELLLWAYKCIFLGPSKWHPKNDKNDQGAIRGNARKHNMDAVTPRSLAYIASHVRFALSSGQQNNKVGGPFCLQTFFWHLMEFFNDPDFKSEVDELMIWWNEQIFPQNQQRQEDTIDNGNDSLNVMKKQAAQRAAKEAAITGQASGGEGGVAANPGGEGDTTGSTA